MIKYIITMTILFNIYNDRMFYLIIYIYIKFKNYNIAIIIIINIIYLFIYYYYYFQSLYCKKIVSKLIQLLLLLLFFNLSYKHLVILIQ